MWPSVAAVGRSAGRLPSPVAGWADAGGFWTPEYLEDKLRKVAAAGLDNLVLVVYRGLAAGEEDDPALEALPAAVVWFKNRPRIGPGMEAVERVGGYAVFFLRGPRSVRTIPSRPIAEVSSMKFEVSVPVWRRNVAEALAEAGERRRIVIMKPLGQGCGSKDDW